MADAEVQVDGLSEFKTELRRLNQALPRELRVASKRVADFVAEKTRASFETRGGVAPKVAPSVKALAGQLYAAVRIGGDAYPFAMGSNFGALRYPQFPQWAGRGEDYSLYKSIHAEEHRIVETYGDAVEDIARRAFPD